jgi:hypothetical protein
MERLLAFVIKVRNALMLDQVKKAYVGFYDFPRGSCMDASILLGVLLERNSFGEFNLVSACDDIKSSSHAWLENESHVIDVTADQFIHWPKQSLIIEKELLPQHYNEFEIQWIEPVLLHQAIPDLGYFVALNLVEKTICL